MRIRKEEKTHPADWVKKRERPYFCQNQAKKLYAWPVQLKGRRKGKRKGKIRKEREKERKEEKAHPADWVKKAMAILLSKPSKTLYHHRPFRGV